MNGLSKLILIVSVGLTANLSWGANATGALCKQHLSLVTQILNREAVGQYWQINDEITNVIGIPLSTITQKQGTTPLVRGFINVVSNTINNCQKNCEGVALGSGQTLSCSQLSNRNILDLARYGKLIDETSVGSLVNDEQTSAIVQTPVVSNPVQNGGYIHPRPECRGDENSETCREDQVSSVRPQVTPVAVPMECLFDQNSEMCRAHAQPTPTVQEVIQRPLSPVSSEI